MQWVNKIFRTDNVRSCGAGCGTILRVDDEGSTPPNVPPGPWFCRTAECRVHRDQRSTPAEGEFGDALRSVAREIVASGLADDLDLPSGRRTRYFTPAGDDIVLDNDLVGQVRNTFPNTAGHTSSNPAVKPTTVSTVRMPSMGDRASAAEESSGAGLH